MAESDELIVPDAAKHDPQSFELLRVWTANKGLQVSLRTAVWDDPFAYGIMLCDLMKHIANAYHQNEGRDWSEAFERIKAGLDAELAAPTAQPMGR
jgi:Domain of unknown function (DUF5076)